MKKSVLTKPFSLSMVILMITAGSAFSDKYKKTKNPQSFEVSFADPVWNGKDIPEDQRCRRFKGKGVTPSLIIKGIPEGTNAFIMEFSDRNSNTMNYGGHGKIGYFIENGAKEVTIPSVPGHTFDLPDNFFLVRAHKLPSWDKAGAYMPPCSGGKRHLYYVTVKAVYKDPEGKNSTLFGTQKLEMGRY